MGLGGIGKSRCAMEIAHRTRAKRPEYTIFWVRATSLDTVHLGYRYIAETLRLQSRGTPNHDMELVKQYLSSDLANPYLLILDDADDPSLWVHTRSRGQNSRSLLVDYLPRHAQGAILITTRYRQVAVCAADIVLSLGVLDLDSASSLLRSRLHTRVVDESEALEVAKCLTGCPLAMMRASDFINEAGTKLATLLRLFRKNESLIIEMLGTDIEDQDGGDGIQDVRPSWLLSMTQIRRVDPHAFDILGYMCCLGPIDVPFEVLPKAPSPLVQVRSLGLLMGHGILHSTDLDDDFEVFTMQKLAYLATQDWLERTGDLYTLCTSAITNTIVLLNADASPDLFDNPGIYLLPALFRLFETGAKAKVELRYEMLERAAELCAQRNLLDACKKCLQRLTSDSKIEFGQNSSKTLIYCDMLGRTLWDLQHYDQAGPVLEAMLCTSQLPTWFTVAGQLCRIYTKLDDHVKAVELAVRMVDKLTIYVRTSADSLTNGVLQTLSTTSPADSDGRLLQGVSPDESSNVFHNTSRFFGLSHDTARQAKCAFAKAQLYLLGNQDTGSRLRASEGIIALLNFSNVHSIPIAKSLFESVLHDIANDDLSAAVIKMRLIDIRFMQYCSHEETATLASLSLLVTVHRQKVPKIEELNDGLELVYEDQLTPLRSLFTEENSYESAIRFYRAVRRFTGFVDLSEFDESSSKSLQDTPPQLAARIIHEIENLILQWFGFRDWSYGNEEPRSEHGKYLFDYVWPTVRDKPFFVLVITTILSSIWRSGQVRCCAHGPEPLNKCVSKERGIPIARVLEMLWSLNRFVEATTFLEACAQCYGDCDIQINTNRRELLYPKLSGGSRITVNELAKRYGDFIQEEKRIEEENRIRKEKRIEERERIQSPDRHKFKIHRLSAFIKESLTK